LWLQDRKFVGVEMVYEPPPDFDRETMKRLLDSHVAEDQIAALHAAVFS
jgi:hypothetical protein